MTVWALVPARGGSVGIPGKNTRSFCGRPLISWSLAALEEAEHVERVVVATDCEVIAQVVEDLGLEKPSLYWRLPENATAKASTESVCLEYLQAHAAQVKDDDLFLLVQATTPYTRGCEFDAAIEQYLRSEVDSLLSVVRFRRFLWSAEGAPLNYDYRARPRRQELPGSWLENGAFYLTRAGAFRRDRMRLGGEIGLFEMAEFTSVQLDEPDDWIVAEALMRRHILEVARRDNHSSLSMGDRATES